MTGEVLLHDEMVIHTQTVNTDAFDIPMHRSVDTLEPSTFSETKRRSVSMMRADGLKAHYSYQRIRVIIRVYELIMGRPGCVNKSVLRVNRNITDTDTLINSTTKLLSHSTGSICNLKEPGGGNIPLI